MAWKTVENNHIELRMPTGKKDSLRVVWKDGGSDVCYVVPCDGSNGNANARLIASAPELLNACIAIADAVSKSNTALPRSVVDAAGICGLAAMRAMRLSSTTQADV